MPDLIHVLRAVVRALEPLHALGHAHRCISPETIQYGHLDPEGTSRSPRPGGGEELRVLFRPTALAEFLESALVVPAPTSIGPAEAYSRGTGGRVASIEQLGDLACLGDVIYAWITHRAPDGLCTAAEFVERRQWPWCLRPTTAMSFLFWPRVGIPTSLLYLMFRLLTGTVTLNDTRVLLDELWLLYVARIDLDRLCDSALAASLRAKHAVYDWQAELSPTPPPTVEREVTSSSFMSSTSPKLERLCRAIESPAMFSANRVASLTPTCAISRPGLRLLEPTELVFDRYAPRTEFPDFGARALPRSVAEWFDFEDAQRRAFSLHLARASHSPVSRSPFLPPICIRPPFLVSLPQLLAARSLSPDCVSLILAYVHTHGTLLIY